MTDEKVDVSSERNARKVREGLVVSDKMDKTVVVAVEDRFTHRMYGKVVRRTSKLKAHDEANAAGDSAQTRLIAVSHKHSTPRKAAGCGRHQTTYAGKPAPHRGATGRPPRCRRRGPPPPACGPG